MRNAVWRGTGWYIEGLVSGLMETLRWSQLPQESTARRLQTKVGVVLAAVDGGNLEALEAECGGTEASYQNVLSQPSGDAGFARDSMSGRRPRRMCDRAHAEEWWRSV
jgi:hypothetical protein